MRVHVLSDLHLEFEPFTPPEMAADVVVLAGDVDVGDRGIPWARGAFPQATVICVAGNHEHYGEALPRHTDKLRELARGSNVHVLENERLIVDGVVFLGCTLWTDFALFGDPRIAGVQATQWMTDYHRIRVGPEYRKLRSIDTAGLHHHSLVWLRARTEECRGQPVVVVTHHAPSARSLADADRDDILSAAYASHLDDFVEQSGAALWVHGHVHVRRDYRIGSTRVLCNARGYPDEDRGDFRPDLVVEV